MKKFIFVVYISLSLVVSGCSNNYQSVSVGTQEKQMLDDGQIINIMMTVDKGEIAASQEALKKKSSSIVNNYANYLIQQHQSNLDQLMKLSNQSGIKPKESTISNSLVAQGKDGYQELGKLQGKEFDKAFIDAMVKGHQDGLKLIDTKLLQQAKNPQVKASLEQFRTMVADHLEKALKIQSLL